MRALRGMVVGVLLLLTGCVAYGPRPAAYGYGYGYTPGYAYSPAYVAPAPAYVTPAPTIVVPIARYPQYRPGWHRHWRG
jgi:hypothetical protein